MTFANANADLPANRHELAAFIDLMVTAPELTSAQVTELVEQAGEWGFNACYVPSGRLPQPQAQLPVGAMVSYPLGADYSLSKAFSARLAVDQGATEVCVMADLGAIVAGEWNALMADLVTVREAAPAPVILQIVVETAYLLTLSDGLDRISRCCQIALAVGADMVVTGTGLHPAGDGASVEAVRAMAESVGGQLGIKAMGGVSTAAQALELMAAGATQLGCSPEEAAALLAGMPD